MYIPVGWPHRLRLPRSSATKAATLGQDRRGVDLNKSDDDANSNNEPEVIIEAEVAAAATVDGKDASSFGFVVANASKTLFLCVSPLEFAIWNFRPQVI